MNTLTAEKRDLKTKAKKLRKEGYVIGNLFGRDIENSIPLKVDSREAAKFLKDNKKGAHITLLVDGENVDAIVKEIDYNAMKNETKPSREREKNDQEPLLPPIQPVIDYGSVVIKNSRAAIHCLTIAGQIEGHMLLPNTQKATKYEHVLPLLAYLEESEDIDGVLFLLNTVGGDVEAGLAIAELISGMKKPTVSLVLGGGHSIGVPLAVAPMVTMIAPSASMTIHPVRTSGTIIAAPQTYQYFERLQERIVRFVTKNSRIGRDEFLRLMMDTQDLASDVGSVLYGEEAVACGLIQRIGSLSDALDALYVLIDEKKR